MATSDDTATAPPNLADMQHWTWLLGRLQQRAMEHGFDMPAMPDVTTPIAGLTDPAMIERTQDFWRQSVSLWQRMIDPAHAPAPGPSPHDSDKRFRDPRWR